MADLSECDNRNVECTRCNGDGVGCELSLIPELSEECSTMQGVKTGSVMNEGSVAPMRDVELPYDWEPIK